MPTRLPASKTAQFYLIAYNTVCALAWAYVLQRTIQHMRGPTVTAWLPSLWSDRHKFLSRARTAYTDFGKEVQWVQTIAVLEPLHIALGLVRTSLGTTTAQVFSRLLVVYGCLAYFPETQSSAFFVPMVVAWSITEVIRYTNYVSTLLGIRIAPLEYLRYTLFYILYPLGAGSEATFIHQVAPLAAGKFGEPARYAGYALSFLGWPLALTGLMSYMHGQRKKHLGALRMSGKAKGKKRA